MVHPFFTLTDTPRVIAHMGLVTPEMVKRGEVENTFSAFESAVNAGAHYLETDCQLTKDGTVVLFHDADLARVLGDPRLVADVEYGELFEMLQDRGGLLTLQQALETFSEQKFNVDAKDGNASLLIGQTVAPHADRVLLTSFSEKRRRQALYASRLSGGDPATSGGSFFMVRLLILIKTGLTGQAKKLLETVDAIQIPERYGITKVLTNRLLKVANQAGTEVHVWTINEPEKMIKLVDMGVDGLITDRFDLFKATFK